jgi:hypothetical protein
LFVATRPSKWWSGPYVIWTPKTPLVCLIHGMKVGFQVLGPRPDAFQKGSFHRDTTVAPDYIICQ